MTKRAGRSNPSVTTAWPGGHSPMARQAACRRSAPAARWMAPSTPPPPRRWRFAALTTASTRSAVMSPWTAWSSGGIEWLPGGARRRGGGDQLEQREGAGWCRLALVLAPVRERHDPVDGRCPAGVAGVGHLLDRERGTGGGDVHHDGHLAPALGGDRSEDACRLLTGHRGRLAKGVRPTDLELLAYLRGEQTADQFGKAGVGGGEGQPLPGILRRLGLGEADHVGERRLVAVHVSSRPDHLGTHAFRDALVLDDQRLCARSRAGVAGHREGGAVLLGNRGEVHALG